MAGTRHRGQWTRLKRALDDKGIDQAAFEMQAVRVIEATWRSPAADNPASAFTATDAALLARGGLDLAPRRRDEPDVALATATSLAIIETKTSSVADVATVLRVSRARVRQRATERTLYAIRVDDEWRFPRWQFDEQGGPLPGIAKIASALPPGLHPLAVWGFMTQPSADLEILDEQVSPLQWLQAGGDPAPVVAIVREL